MHPHALVWLAIGALGLVAPALAGSGWRVEAGLALPYNVPLPLEITQELAPDLDFTARFASRPFEPPVTWQLRVGRTTTRGSWDLELVHHKLYLEDPPPEVQSFAVSHGFNQLTVQRGFRHPAFDWRLGVGLVIAHPENTVRGRKLAEAGGWHGYMLAGPTLGASIGRPLHLGAGLLVDPEARVSYSYASIPVEGGRARFSNLLVQVAVLLGFETQPR